MARMVAICAEEGRFRDFFSKILANGDSVTLVYCNFKY